ncbi:MAG: flagellar motor protein MotB [Desulfuromonadaceae bacterium]|jgi:chemotaxis protein MotB
MAKRQKKEAAGAPAWMVTFSDMVTLLLTFFVLLLSMANMDKVKFHDAAGSLRDAFGVMKGGQKTSITKPKIVEFAPIQDDMVSRLYQRMLTQFQRLKIDQRIKLVKDRGAIVLRIEEAILFPSGVTEVDAKAYPVLRDVAALIQNLPLNLRIEGHTDESPPGGGITNWDISMARAISVLKFFEREKLVPLDRMSAVGYGSQRPLIKETSPEARALNRRVEFVLESVGSNREALPYLIDASKQAPF